jgi:hypothetical protein
MISPWKQQQQQQQQGRQLKGAPEGSRPNADNVSDGTDVKALGAAGST